MKYPRLFPPGKTKEIRLSEKPQTIRTWLPGAGGMLRAKVFLPAPGPDGKCPMVIIMHGIMTTKDVYPQPAIAKALQTKGIASVTFDFNGHGGSYGRFRGMTVLNEKEDALKVIGYAASLPFVSRIGLAGHSQGGVVAALCAGEIARGHCEIADRLAAVLLMAPAAVCRDDALNGNIMGATFDPSEPPDILKVMMHELGGDYIRVAQQLDIYGEAADYHGPMCVIHGEKDGTVPVRYGKMFKSVCPQCDLHILPQEGHLLNGDKTGVCSMATDFLVRSLL